MRSIFILLSFFQIGFSSRAQCPLYLRSDSTHRYSISINPKHHQFDLLEHFGTRAFSPSLIDSSLFSTFDQIDNTDSLIALIKEYTDGIDTLKRSHNDPISDKDWELLTINITRSYCPAINPWTQSKDVYYFDLKNNSFSYSQIRQSFDTKTGWHRSNLGNKYLIFSCAGEHIANDSSSWAVSYFFRMKEISD